LLLHDKEQSQYTAQVGIQEIRPGGQASRFIQGDKIVQTKSPDIRNGVQRDMKKDIHPEYREVVFRDISVNKSFLTRSTIKTDKTIVWEDGNTYPLVEIEVSNMSHPFYTGQQRLVDVAGRVEKFNRRFKRNRTSEK
jgi:large subunit ribosomal protein L31